MRPAENRDVVTTGPARLETRSRYMAGPWTAWRDAGGVGCETYWDRSVHPATIINPLQPDGSRARSAWTNRFASSPVPSRNILVQNDTPWGEVHQFKILRQPLPSGGIRQAVGWVSSFCAVGGAFPYDVEAQARTNFLRKLAGSKADLGVALGELRQTAGMVSDLAHLMGRGIDKAYAAGRGLPKKVVREVLNFGRVPARRAGEAAGAYGRRVRRERAVLNAWLTTQFGLIPLVNDISEVGQALSDSLFEKSLPLRLTITAGSKATIPGTGTDDYGAIANVLCDVYGEAEYGCHISADYDIPLSQSRNWNQWGMANPAVVAWELAQLSWMVDYVFQVGQWLESLSASAGTIPLGGSISYIGRITSLRSRLRGRYTVRVLTPSGWQNLPVGQIGSFQRSLVGAVFPAARPTIRNKVNLTRMANILSVLALKAGR